MALMIGVAVPGIEPRLTHATRALRLRPPLPGEAGRGRRRAAARAARALSAARRPGEPALPTHARSCAWRPRVAAQGVMTGMGTALVDGATCPRGTAPRCRDPKSRPLCYGRAGTFHAASALREMAVAYGPRYSQDTDKMVQDDSKSMSQHRERDRDRHRERDRDRPLNRDNRKVGLLSHLTRRATIDVDTSGVNS